MSKQLIISYFILGTLLMATAVFLAITAALTPAYSLYIPSFILIFLGGGLVLKPAEKTVSDIPKQYKDFIEK